MDTVKFCKTKKCCPEVQVLDEEDGSRTFIIGGKDEGTTVFSKRNFKDFVDAVKEGKFDAYIR